MDLIADVSVDWPILALVVAGIVPAMIAIPWAWDSPRVNRVQFTAVVFICALTMGLAFVLAVRWG